MAGDKRGMSGGLLSRGVTFICAVELKDELHEPRNLSDIIFIVKLKDEQFSPLKMVGIVPSPPLSAFGLLDQRPSVDSVARRIADGLLFNYLP